MQIPGRCQGFSPAKDNFIFSQIPKKFKLTGRFPCSLPRNPSHSLIERRLKQNTILYHMSLLSDRIVGFIRRPICVRSPKTPVYRGKLSSIWKWHKFCFSRESLSEVRHFCLLELGAFPDPYINPAPFGLGR